MTKKTVSNNIHPVDVHFLGSNRTVIKFQVNRNLSSLLYFQTVDLVQVKKNFDSLKFD